METTRSLLSGRPPAPGTDDATLISRALGGDRGAFETLVRRHRRPLVNHLFRQIGQREAALDLAQEVFLKVYQSLGSYDPRYRFTTWLYRIASNAAIDQFRRRHVPTCGLESDSGDPSEDRSRTTAGSDPSPDQILQARELSIRIDRAIQRLPVEFRQLILLRHRQHCRYDEIARITDLPLGTVKNRIFRAREILRVELADLLESQGGCR